MDILRIAVAVPQNLIQEITEQLDERLAHLLNLLLPHSHHSEQQLHRVCVLRVILDPHCDTAEEVPQLRIHVALVDCQFGLRIGRSGRVFDHQKSFK